MMATCRDCLYQTICDVYSNLGVTDIPASDVSICELFKAKADVAEVKHGEWELCDDAFVNDVEYHRCSDCKSEAIFECIYQPIYDENYDGEMEYIAEEFAGINEFLTDYCPKCGAKMDGGTHDKT